MLSILGWREWVRLPTLGIAIKAKIDTGALTSSVHAFDLREYVDRGCPMVEFSLHPKQRSDEFSVTVVAEVVGRRRVRSSNGRAERRVVVAMDVQLGSEAFETEFTLTDRDAMGFRMLLGRRALRNRFVVDVSRSFLAGRRPS